MNTNQFKHFQDVMLKLNFQFVSYIVTLGFCTKCFHKYNKKRPTDLNVGKRIMDNISKMKDENKQCNYCFIKNILK